VPLPSGSRPAPPSAQPPPFSPPPRAGAEATVVYQYGTAPAQRYYFCSHCGVASFYLWYYCVDVNVRCLDDVDIAALPRRTFDGLTCEQAREKDGPWWHQWHESSRRRP
jgi:hypothetical protein